MLVFKESMPAEEQDSIAQLTGIAAIEPSEFPSGEFDLIHVDEIGQDEEVDASQINASEGPFGEQSRFTL
ncbi:MAG: hypothetical protein AAF366_20300 [Pseudomonadota bacterium]